MVDKKLLALLRCPVTKQPLHKLSRAQLDKLNAAISAGNVRHHSGRPVEATMDAALINEGGNTIYKIVEDIPVMVEDESIAVAQLGEF